MLEPEQSREGEEWGRRPIGGVKDQVGEKGALWRGTWLGISQYKCCEKGVYIGGAVLTGARATWRNG